METRTPNAELAYRVLDHIDAHPEQWNQGRWIGKAECGTVGCFAGWAVMLSGGEPIFEEGAWLAVWAEWDGGMQSVPQLAEWLLRVGRWVKRDGVAEDLFDGRNTREDLGRLVEEIFGPRPEPTP